MGSHTLSVHTEGSCQHGTTQVSTVVREGVKVQ